MDWLPILRELGGLGLAGLMAWKVYTVLDRNTRVLERIEGFLIGQGLERNNKTERRDQ